MTFSNKMARLATHKNSRAGNIGRILKGSVPALKAAYGYRYRRDAEITSDGKVHIKKAWWEIDEADADGAPLENTPVWIVTQISKWIGTEGRSSFWVAKRLNDMGLRAPAGGIWAPNRVCKVVHRQCYTGRNVYNSNCMVPNPNRPIGDITAQVRRTILRPKPEEEWAYFNVPSIVSEELWQKANDALTKRGRGRGKQGKGVYWHCCGTGSYALGVASQWWSGEMVSIIASITTAQSTIAHGIKKPVPTAALYRAHGMRRRGTLFVPY